MPASADHKTRAAENEEFQRVRLDADDPVEQPWIVTVMFYAAVHWVEAYLALQNIHSRGHFQRLQHIATDPKLVPIHDAYRELEDRSRDARYELRAFTRQEIEDLRTRCLAPIQQRLSLLVP